MTKQKSRSLLLALSVGAASVLTFSNGTKAAAPEVYFYPTQSWEVSMAQMEVANANVQSCLIKNEFNNGFIVQIDGSHEWVKGMSIDFRQDVFTTGQDYNVSFAVPGKMTRDIPAKASDKHLLVFDMQDQKAVYQAMRDSSVIDLNIDNNDFRFYMTGFTNAATEFERCMAGGFAQPEETGLQASMSENPYETITMNESIALEEAERNVQMPKVTGEDSFDEMAAAKYTPPPQNDLATPEAKYNTPPETIQEPAAIVSTTTSVDNTFIPPSYDDEKPRRRMTEMLAAEIEQNPDIIAFENPAPITSDLRQDARQEPLALPPSYEDEPQEMAKAPPPPSQPVMQKPAFSEAIQEESEKHTDVVTKDMATAETETMQEKEALLPADDNTPSTATTTHMKSRIKVNKEVAYLEADFTKDLASVEPASASMDYATHTDPELIKKISQLENIVTSLESENAALNDEIKSALKESEDERMSISSDNWNLERATMRYNEAERQVKRIGQQLQRERMQCEMEKKDLETMLFDPQVTKQQQLSRLADLERQLEAAQRQLKTNGQDF